MSKYAEELICERKLIIAKYYKRHLKALFYWIKLNMIRYLIKLEERKY